MARNRKNLLGDDDEAAERSRNRQRKHEADSGKNSEPVGDMLRGYIERVEYIAAEKKVLMEQEKEVYAEAKGRGLDTKIIRKIIAERKRNPDDVAEEEAVMLLYKQALGME